MGDARRRRLTLIKGGKADQAKQLMIAPERLTNITIQIPALKAKVLSEVYRDRVNKTTCPTPNDFYKAVFEAGMIEFEKYYIAENQKRDIETTPEEGGEA